METVIINTKDSKTAKFILELAKKIGENGKILSSSEQEDFFLGSIMNSEKTGEIITREAVFKKLRK